MRLSFWIPAIVFYYAVKIVCSNCVQVGTVLFTTTDLVKKCWSESDKALLRARLILQDVLPDPDCIDFSKPDAVVTLLDYFQYCYNIIGLSTYGKLQNLMFLALSDTIGGYLQGYILPLTRKAYYSGHVKYSDAKKIFRLYEDIRTFLKTNGLGWAKPQKVCKFKFRAKPLVIGDTGGESPCNQLYTIERKSNLKNTCILKLKIDDCDLNERVSTDNFRTSRSNFSKNDTETNEEFKHLNRKELRDSKGLKNRKDGNLVKENKEIVKNDDEETKGREDQKDEEEEEEEENVSERPKKCMDFCTEAPESPECVYTKIIIPLPVLEDCSTLHTIAVPFKNRPLRNIQSRRSAFILEHYYITVIKCLVSKSSQEDIKSFNAQFQSWLTTQVFPHLDDEQWYPAFGGVYRITETIKKLGTENPSKEYGTHDIGFMFSKGFEFEDKERSKRLGKEKARDVESELIYENEDIIPKRYYYFGVIILILVGLCTLCACVSYCCAYRWRKNDPLANSGLRNKETFLNFQFLIKFFKRDPTEAKDNDEGEDEKKDDEDENVEGNDGAKGKADSTTKKKINYSLPDDKEVSNRKQSEIRKAVPVSLLYECNVKTAKPCLDSLVAPTWPYVEINKSKLSEITHQLECSNTKEKKKKSEEKKKVETLWIKPKHKKIGVGDDIDIYKNVQKTEVLASKSITGNKPSKRETNVVCSSCYYSESQTNNGFTTTNSVSRTWESTGGSESIIDAEYTSESESIETT